LIQQLKILEIASTHFFPQDIFLVELKRPNDQSDIISKYFMSLIKTGGKKVKVSFKNSKFPTIFTPK